jgi:dipeptidase
LESAWWAFNLVSNIVNLKYSFMAPEVLAVQAELEGNFIALQPAVDQTAKSLSESNHDLMTRYLTDYSVMAGEMVMMRWVDLGEHLLTKYNDGYVKNEKGRPTEKGYPESWLKRVLRERADDFRLPVKAEDKPESELVD